MPMVLTSLLLSNKEPFFQLSRAGMSLSKARVVQVKLVFSQLVPYNQSIYQSESPKCSYFHQQESWQSNLRKWL